MGKKYIIISFKVKRMQAGILIMSSLSILFSSRIVQLAGKDTGNLLF